MQEAVQEQRKVIHQNVAVRINQLKKEQNAMQRQLKTMSGRRFIHDRRDLESTLNALENEMIALESGSKLRRFEEHAKVFLEKATEEGMVAKRINRDNSFFAQKKNNGRQARKRTTARNIKVQDNTGTTMTAANGAAASVLMDEFNAQYNDKIPTIYMVVGDVCKHCDGGKMCKIENQMVCNQCGNAVSFIDSSSDSLAFHDEVEYSNFSYRRIAHFTEWLSNFQARENTKISETVLEQIMFKLKEQKITDVDEITPQLIRKILKQLKLNKYYDNTVLISCLLSGRTPPRLTPQQEDTLKRMFLMIQDSFEKHCPAERKNFLSYSYIIRKFCELLGLPYLEYFSLLKCKEKLAKMDAIFEKICKDLDWEFIPSVV